MGLGSAALGIMRQSVDERQVQHKRHSTEDQADHDPGDMSSFFLSGRLSEAFFMPGKIDVWTTRILAARRSWR
jgi:hypothetical protein